MAELTREEVIEKVRKGESLAGKDLSALDLGNANLSGADLSGANLSRADLSISNISGSNLSGAKLMDTTLDGTTLSGANLCRTNLIRARFSNAKLIGVDLKDSDLCSANLEFADLSGADLTGANIFNIATAFWKIDGVKCEHVYNFHYSMVIDGRKKTRRDFAPGEFERFFKSFPKLELIYKEEFSGIDYRALLEIVERLNKELPAANLKPRKLENVGNTITLTLTAETNEAIKKIADKLPEQYTILQAEIEAIKQRLPAHQTPPSLLPLPNWLTQINEIAGKNPDSLLNLPSTIIVMNQPKDFIMPTAHTSGHVQIGNQTVNVYQTQIINNFLDRLDSSSFNDAEVMKVDQEFQVLYDNLNSQERNALCDYAKKLIEEKANKESGFVEKLKQFGKRVANKSLEIGTGVLINFLAEYAKQRSGLG